MRVPVVVAPEAELECYAHVLGETHRVTPRSLERAHLSAEEPGWVIYLRGLKDARPQVHIYYGDVQAIARRAMNRRDHVDQANARRQTLRVVASSL